MKAITVELPDTLADKAEGAGLLAPNVVAEVVWEALRRQGAIKLRETMDKLHAANFPPMTMDEIQAIVNEVRAERRRKR